MSRKGVLRSSLLSSHLQTTVFLDQPCGSQNHLVGQETEAARRRFGYGVPFPSWAPSPAADMIEIGRGALQDRGMLNLRADDALDAVDLRHRPERLESASVARDGPGPNRRHAAND